MYIVNQYNHYFKVNCNIDVTKLHSCMFFKTLEDMYQHVSETNNLDLDEVEGYEVVIDHDGTSYTIFEFGFSLNEFEPTSTIEEFISDYML